MCKVYQNFLSKMYVSANAPVFHLIWIASLWLAMTDRRNLLSYSLMCSKMQLANANCILLAALILRIRQLLTRVHGD